MSIIIDYYNKFDEWGRLDREPLEFIINMHHIRANLPTAGRILDNGAGPGKYSIELAKQGYQITLSDLTPRLVEVAQQKATEFKLIDQFEGFHVMDACDLSSFTDEQFDATIMLGPMYHLQSEKARIQAIQELHRVTKSGGVVFVAFMSRTKFLHTSLHYPLFWKPNHTSQGISTFLETGVFNHIDEGRFTEAYYYPIEEIATFMEVQGFHTDKLVGSSSVATSMSKEQWDYWKDRGEDEFNTIMNIILEQSDNPYILGSSSHIMYIGRKQ
ncbi:class I SAM-dependent methyltransferase [Paenibacillus endoradicis]|uniref:class I SAM-dependent methyltransferase n=1 Tax=Paenibacillus endoradicis TaxID=2972487 RepID=UPI002158A1E3|nr:class I SAM-dependent methyltransferase [Paenibacillus endoradicis]MCR8656423.1 class I SAM-dependent methyltransferase [Paenibacillus endoradicis]